MKSYYFIIPIILITSSPAFSILPDGNNPDANPAGGGPIVPVGNSTMQQYCWNSICHTSPAYNNGTLFGNNTNYEMLTHYNIIMIIPSEGCTSALLHHVKTSCPPLANITKYDNSNQHISGYFYSPDGSIITRSSPQVKNHWQYYGYTNKTIICVYCTGNYLTTDLYKTIILGSSDNFEYTKHDFITSTISIPQYNAVNGNVTVIKYPINEQISSLKTYLNRDVQGCNTATISYSDFLLNDTINYLENGCTKTKFNMTNTYHGSNTPWIWENPYSTLHYKAVTDKIKSDYLGDCTFHKCNLTTSIRKW